jgi:plastocyanin
VKRLVTLGALLAMCAAPASAGVMAVGVSNTPPPDEFGFVLTKTKAGPGPAIIEYTNTGEDDHDLKMKRLGSKRVWELPRLAHGTSDRIEIDLKPDSRYVLWCSLPDHRERGMEATLRVRR